MEDFPWLKRYSGESAGELLDLVSKYRTDSFIFLYGSSLRT